MAYIHGTEAGEQARLSELNRMTNGAFVGFLGVAAGERVLEVGSGLGLLAAGVAGSAAGVEVTGVEKSAEQLAAAMRAPGVRYVQGDAQQLGFAPGSFDVVYARYLLEHVADAAAVVSEMRRVLRPGGRIALQENDISLLRVDPPCPAFEEVWSAFAAYQRQLGGDALIGRRLFRLLRNAGFAGIEISVQPEVHWQGSPGFESWIRNLIGNIAGATGLGRSGLCTGERIEEAAAELEELIEREDASSIFVWNRAAAGGPRLPRPGERCIP